MSARYTHKQSGFTLVEVLIALFIFSLISVASMAALSGSLRGKAQLEENLAELRDIETSRMIMQGDLSAIILQETRDALGAPEPFLLTGGRDSLMAFTRTGRQNPGGIEPRGDLQRVIYLFENDQLIRRSLSQVNPGPNSPYRDRVLLEGLDSVRMEFISQQRRAPTWQIVAGADELGAVVELDVEPEPELQAVRFELDFAGGRRLSQLFEVGL